MLKVTAVLALAGLIALALPSAHADVVDKNVQHYLDALGFSSLPTGVATVHANGESREMSIAEALTLAASRANGRDVGAPTAVLAPNPDGPFGVGDVWVTAASYGACPAPSPFVATPVPSTETIPLLFTYAGGAGTATSEDNYYVEISDWTTGATGGIGSGSVSIAGQSDFWCAELKGLALFAPHVDGAAWTG